MSQRVFNRKALCIAIVALGASLGASAQYKSDTPATSGTSQQAGRSDTSGKSGASHEASKLDSAERKFVEKAAIDGMAEVELGKLAQQKAASDQVKQFASRMVEDHSKANDELKQIASMKGLQVPTALDKGHQKDMENLSKRSGADFDKKYMDHMVSEHKKDVSMFEKEAKSGKDPELKAFAAKTLPKLQEHMKLAQNVHEGVKSTKKADTGERAAAPKQ